MSRPPDEDRPRLRVIEGGEKEKKSETRLTVEQVAELNKAFGCNTLDYDAETSLVRETQPVLAEVARVLDNALVNAQKQTDGSKRAILERLMLDVEQDLRTISSIPKWLDVRLENRNNCLAICFVMDVQEALAPEAPSR